MEELFNYKTVNIWNVEKIEKPDEILYSPAGVSVLILINNTKLKLMAHLTISNEAETNHIINNITTIILNENINIRETFPWFVVWWHQLLKWRTEAWRWPNNLINIVRKTLQELKIVYKEHETTWKQKDRWTTWKLSKNWIEYKNIEEHTYQKAIF